MTKPSERQNPSPYGVLVPGTKRSRTGGDTLTGATVCVMGGASGTGASGITFESSTNVTPFESSGMLVKLASMTTFSALPIGPLMSMPPSAWLRRESRDGSR